MHAPRMRGWVAACCASALGRHVGGASLSSSISAGVGPREAQVPRQLPALGASKAARTLAEQAASSALRAQERSHACLISSRSWYELSVGKFKWPRCTSLLQNACQRSSIPQKPACSYYRSHMHAHGCTERPERKGPRSFVECGSSESGGRSLAHSADCLHVDWPRGQSRRRQPSCRSLTMAMPVGVARLPRP